MRPHVTGRRNPEFGDGPIDHTQGVESGLTEDRPDGAREIPHRPREQLLGGLPSSAFAMLPGIKADGHEPRCGQLLQTR